MLRRIDQRLLIRPEDLRPSIDGFEVVGAFNPGVIDLGDEVVLLVRVAERPGERRGGFTPLPRWVSAGDAADRSREPGSFESPRVAIDRPGAGTSAESREPAESRAPGESREPAESRAPGESRESGVVIDWMSDDQLRPIDPRVVQRLADGCVRLTFLSHLRVFRSRDGREIDREEPARFWPHGEGEEYGVEDPRITRLDGRHYITYVAVSRHGATTALASTDDFASFERHGTIFHPENKDVVLFPERIGGRYAALHRPTPATPFSMPEMWFAQSPDLLHWGGHRPLAGGGEAWQSGRVGAGTPPIAVPGGWLEIYHGSRKAAIARKVGTYSGSALLLDRGRPHRVLKRSREPLLAPVTDFETRGFVPNVVFPTGVVERGETLLVYYGAADAYCAMVEWSRDELLAALE